MISAIAHRCAVAAYVDKSKQISAVPRRNPEATLLGRQLLAAGRLLVHAGHVHGPFTYWQQN